MGDDNVTGAEFGRWRSDFAAFQDRLESRLSMGFGQINARLDELNGRTRKNSEGLGVLDARVSSIQEQGCAQIHAHRELVTEASALAAPAPSRKRDAAMAGGGAGLFVIFDLILKWVGIKLGL